MSVASLNCPVCSGPMTLGKERCDYCGSTIVIKTDMVRIDPMTLNQGVIHQHIADFRNRVFANPNDAVAHYGLGIAYFNLGLVEEANTSLGEAARLMPENANIKLQQAKIMWGLCRTGRQRDLGPLLECLDRVLYLRPGDAEAMVLKAGTQYTAGATLLALDTLQAVPASAAYEVCRVLGDSVAPYGLKIGLSRIVPKEQNPRNLTGREAVANQDAGLVLAYARGIFQKNPSAIKFGGFGVDKSGTCSAGAVVVVTNAGFLASSTNVWKVVASQTGGNASDLVKKATVPYKITGFTQMRAQEVVKQIEMAGGKAKWECV